MIVFPLGLAYIASMLKEHELMCWDPNLSEDPLTELSKTLNSFNPDLVGLSLRNIDSVLSWKVRSYYEPFISMIKIIKKYSPSSKLIVGGSGFSIFANEIIGSNLEIDFGVVSEGDRVIVELTKNLDNPEKVKNLLFRKEGQIYSTPRDNFIDFSSLLLRRGKASILKNIVSIHFRWV